MRLEMTHMLQSKFGAVRADLVLLPIEDRCHLHEAVGRTSFADKRSATYVEDFFLREVTVACMFVSNTQ